jgi:hypothetical protein
LAMFVTLGASENAGAVYYDCTRAGCDECYSLHCIVTLYNANCNCWANGNGCAAWGACKYEY